MAVSGVTLVAPTYRGEAAPRRADPDPAQQLEQVSDRANRLEKLYRGQLVGLGDAKRAAKAANSRAAKVAKQKGVARKQVRRLAITKYKNGWLDPFLYLIASDNPRTALSQSAMVEHLARTSSMRLRELQRLIKKHERAEEAARERVARYAREVDQLEKRKEHVRALVDRYEEQLAAQRAREEQQELMASCESSITARMCQVKSAIVAGFGEPYGVGCYRPGSFGEHPSGRACDFMLSSGGAMPSESEVARGYDIAEWAVENAEEVGIMYIIYRQRIYDVRTCSCWEYMEDRGSVTANHYDHVHVSVF